jgi:hypothetical protein
MNPLASRPLSCHRERRVHLTIQGSRSYIQNPELVFSKPDRVDPERVGARRRTGAFTMTLTRCRVIAPFIALCLVLPASTSFSDWSDLPGIKSREATQKAEDRAGSEVDKHVDNTVNCIFNPGKCAKKLKRDDAPESGPTPSMGGADAGPPRPPSASRPKGGPPPPPSARIWYIDIGDGNTRAVGETELIAMIARGEVRESTPVWTDTFGADYQAAGDVSQLQRHFSE